MSFKCGFSKTPGNIAKNKPKLHTHATYDLKVRLHNSLPAIFTKIFRHSATLHVFLSLDSHIHACFSHRVHHLFIPHHFLWVWPPQVVSLHYQPRGVRKPATQSGPPPRLCTFHPSGYQNGSSCRMSPLSRIKSSLYANQTAEISCIPIGSVQISLFKVFTANYLVINRNSLIFSKIHPP